MTLFSRFLILSIPLLLALGYMIFALSEKIDKMILLRLGGGALFLYSAMLYFVWSTSCSVKRKEDLFHDYAKSLEEKMQERIHKIEELTARELEAAKEVARLKDEFIFIAAHELRTPVAELKWTIDTIRREQSHDSLPPDLEKRLASLESLIERLAALISDLLDVARLESFKLIFEKTPLNLGKILETCVADLQAMAEKEGIIIQFAKEDVSSLPAVLGDELKLKEVFNNLLSNAIKFNHPGGTVEIKALASPPFVEVSVRDNGMGIKKEHFPKLFTKFFRAHENIEGTGLGLWISKEIMRRLDGDILVESEEGKGSTFTVKIPAI